MLKIIKTQLFGSTNSKKIHPENNPAGSHPVSLSNYSIMPKKLQGGVNTLCESGVLRKPISNDMPVSIERTNGKNPPNLGGLNEKRYKTIQGIKLTEDRDPCYTIYLRCKDPTAYDCYKASN